MSYGVIGYGCGMNRPGAGKGVGADIGVERAALEQRGRGGGRQSFESDLLRVGAGIERQLVSGSGRSHTEEAKAEQHEPAAHGRTSTKQPKPHEREKGEGRRFPPPFPQSWPGARP